MIGPTDLLHPSPAPYFKTFQAFLIFCPKVQEMTIHILLKYPAMVESKCKIAAYWWTDGI